MSSELLPCGERAVRCLLGKTVDRVPFGGVFGWGAWNDAFERWSEEAGRPISSLREELGLDHDAFRRPRIHPGIYPPFPLEILEETERFKVWRDDRGRLRRDRHDWGSMPEWLEHPVRTPADWQRFKAERLVIGAPGRIQEDWDSFRSIVAVTGQAVQVGCYPYGVFGTARDFLGDKALLYAFYDEPDMVSDVMSHCTSLWIDQWERVAAEVRIDHIHIWEDMAGRNGTLISPDMIERFMMPCYDRIADFARQHGVPIVSMDSDGDINALVPLVRRHGVNTVWPFEVQAGSDMLAFRRADPHLGIIGGLDKRALGRDRAAVDHEIERGRRMIASGRYIPAWDHHIPSDTTWPLVVRAVDAIRDLCLCGGERLTGR